ncbi:AI-2E family transporter [Aureimonas altamirensis]|uniref:AI-2E family transporter n=1 Tax=Aureimonas altamirensis TaxID=370622 RepID=UPI0030171EA9
MVFRQASSPDLARQTVTVTAIVLAMVVGLLTLYVGSSAVFILFASFILAAIFDGCSKLFQWIGIPRPVALLLSYLAIFALVATPVALGGVALVQQWNELFAAVEQQFGRALEALRDSGLPVGGGSDGDTLSQLLPDPSGVFSSASQAVFSVLGGFGNIFVMLFLAIFISWQPGLYRRGLVSLVPKDKRARFDDVLRKSAHSLRLWLAGVGISMVIVFVVSWIGLWAIGMPYAFLLALQAGFLAFIPTIGPFAAGVIIVLAAWSEGMEMALWALGVYLLIQGVESNVAEPIAQRFTSSIAPALMVGAQLLFGVLFGLLGLILVVPMLAVAQTLVSELYVKDVLGGPVEEGDGS